MRKRMIVIGALVLFSLSFIHAQTLKDSLVIDGKAYTLHKVQKGETLYGVCNKYKVDMTEVAVLNKLGTGGYSLAEGEIIVVPLYAKKPLIDIKDYKVSDDGYITHVVKPGETLFSISRNYNGVTPQMIRDRNNLKSDTLKINQQLFIPQQINVGAIYKPKVDDNENSTPIKEPSVNERRSLADFEKKYKAAENAASSVEVTRGVANWQDDAEDENQKSFYALHRYAPIGSIVKVRNLMNNRISYVKVIGKLPDIEVNKNVMIMVSAATARQLHALDAKFLIELTIPEEGARSDNRR